MQIKREFDQFIFHVACVKRAKQETVAPLFLSHQHTHEGGGELLFLAGKKLIIGLAGIPGSGKTTCAESLIRKCVSSLTSVPCMNLCRNGHMLCSPCCDLALACRLNEAEEIAVMVPMDG